jgi:hypothetical protein
VLSDYLNQWAVFTPALRGSDGGAMTDDRGNILYGAEADIPVRRERAMNELLRNDSQVLRITDIYYTQTTVRAGDMLNGRRVRRAKEWVELSGEAVGYMAAV